MKGDLEDLDEFFSIHPEEMLFEVENPLGALEADTRSLEKMSLEKSKKTEFQIRCEKGENKVARDIRKWVRADNDVVICVDGREGSGKSFWVIMRFAKKLDPSFILERNVLFRPTPESLEQRLFEVNQYGVLVLDETMETMYKRQSATSSNIGINKLFGRVRKFNRIVILILPNFDDLDAFFRERRVKVRVNIIERGLGFVMVAKDIVGNDDPWFSTYNKAVLVEAEKDGLDTTKATGHELLAMYEQFKTFQTPICWQLEKEDAELWSRYKKMAEEANLNAKNEDMLREERLSKPEKAYRKLFAELSKRFMETGKFTHEETYALFPKMLGYKPPFTFEAFKFLTTERKGWKQMRKEAKMMVRVQEGTTKPKDLLGDI